MKYKSIWVGILSFQDLPIFGVYFDSAPCLCLSGLLLPLCIPYSIPLSPVPILPPFGTLEIESMAPKACLPPGTAGTVRYGPCRAKLSVGVKDPKAYLPAGRCSLRRGALQDLPWDRDSTPPP